MMMAGGALNWILSLAVLAIAALAWGGVKLMRQDEDRKRGILMLIAAIVVAGNVAILAWP